MFIVYKNEIISELCRPPSRRYWAAAATTGLTHCSGPRHRAEVCSILWNKQKNKPFPLIKKIAKE